MLWYLAILFTGISLSSFICDAVELAFDDIAPVL